MIAMNGYFDGTVFVPLTKEKIQPRQKAIITVLDEFMPPKRNLKKFVGKVSKEDSDLVAQAVEDGRKVDLNEW
ncbi:MAG: hypothetical protein IKA37_01080 [Spirochaetales bacterium]|jgi:hypothetical protein|nr:hypothetical protein [Spirochaetales bacterium]